jgi:hypothetical protein
MARRDARGHLLDLRAVADVALLGLGADLRSQRLQPLLSARKEDAAPAAAREQAGDGGTDAARPAGYDGDANVSSVLRLMATVSSIGSA